jgi:hypothetical protein
LLVNLAQDGSDTGAQLSCNGDDLVAIGSLDPLVPGMLGAIAIHDDGTRRLGQVVPDPLAE